MLAYILGITKRDDYKPGQVLGTTNQGKMDYK